MKDIRRVAFCPHCNNKAPQSLICSRRFEEKGYGTDGSESTADSTYYVASCDTCNRILVYYDFCETFSPEEFASADLVWPQKKTLHPSAPKHIRQIYEEAVLIQQYSPDAFATQIRKGLEAICIDRGVNKKTLHIALEERVKKGEIPPVLAEFTDVLRLLGNIGAHWTGQHVHPLQTNTLNEFFRAIVEYIYVAPSRLKEFRNSLPKFREFYEINSNTQK